LVRLSLELVKLQDWIKQQGLRVVVLFEGRGRRRKGRCDQAHRRTPQSPSLPGGGLGTPTEREKTQRFFQRYASHLPAAGEMVLFDRSWYNRAGVEHVMGFSTEEEYWEFLHSVPEFEKMLMDKKRARLNCISHLLSVIPYKDVELTELKLPPRQPPTSLCPPPNRVHAVGPCGVRNPVSTAARRTISCIALGGAYGRYRES
jgi:polyphosphate kinase 2 (PPK2 family)